MDATNAPVDDLSALAWVQDELRKSLDAAHKALRRTLKEAETAAGADIDAVEPTGLRMARQQLHQGVGVLELVGLPAGATLLRASEAAVQRFVSRPHKLNAAAVDAVEQASFALLDYLARRLAGKTVSPVALFPQYRAVQELAGADRVHPADLWSYDWQWKSVPLLDEVAPRSFDARSVAEFEGLVLATMRSGTPDDARRLSDLCAGLAAGAALDKSSNTVDVWSLAAAVYEAQAQGLLEADNFSKRLSSRLLSQMRSLQRGDTAAPERLAQDLAFFCALARTPADGQAPRLEAVRNGYGLVDESLPSNYAEPVLGRYDPAWVAQARKRVSTAKDSWSAVAAGEMHRLTGLNEQFSLVGDSLRRLVPAGERLADALARAVGQTVQSATPPTPALAMEVATSVLYLEACIDDGAFDQPDQAERVQRLAQRIDAVQAGGSPHALESWMEELYRRVSDRQTMGSVVAELRAALSESEKLIDHFFRQPDDTAALMAVPGQLQTMRGVLSVLGIDQASQAVLRLRDDVEVLMQEGAEVARGRGVFDRLASNLSALSFLIDLLGVQPQAAKSLFVFDAASGLLQSPMARRAPAPSDAAEGAVSAAVIEHAQDLAAAAVRPEVSLAEVSRELERLNLDFDHDAQPALAASLSTAQAALEQAELPGAGPATESFAREQVAEALTDFVATASDAISLDAGPTTSAAPLMSLSAMPTSATPVTTGLEGDDEMREIFLEEAREVSASAGEALAALRHTPDDIEQLTTVRRAFHTLKGSSRMVGLNQFGEAAWSCEQLYNTWMASQEPATPDLLDATGDLLGHLGSWVEAIAQGRDAGFEAAPISRLADALRLNGQRGQATALPSAAPEPVEVEAERDDGPLSSWDALPASPAPEQLPDAPAAAVESIEELDPQEGEATDADDALAERQALDISALLPPASELEFAAEQDTELLAPDLQDASSDDGTDLPPLPETDAAPDDASTGSSSAGLDFTLDLGDALTDAPQGPSPEPIDAALPLVVEPDQDALEAFDELMADASKPVPLESAADELNELASATDAVPLEADEPEAAQADAVITSYELEVLPSEALASDETPDLLPETFEGEPERVFEAEAAAEVHTEADLDAQVDGVVEAAQVEATKVEAAEVEAVPMAALESDSTANAPEHAFASATVDDEPSSTPETLREDDQVKVIGDLRISIPLFNIFLNEADELSRRLGTELSEWALELHRPVGEPAIALAHSLGGSSSTVGFSDLSSLARQLEHTLMRSQVLGHGRPTDAALFIEAADEVRRLLHQFAAGFLKPVPADLIERLSALEQDLDARVEEQVSSTRSDVGSDFAASTSQGGLLDLVEAGDSTPEAPPVSTLEEPAPTEAQADAADAPTTLVAPALGQAEFKPFQRLAEEPVTAASAQALDSEDDIDAIDSVDPELFPFFEEEGQELLPQLAAQLRDWLDEPNEAARPAACMRTLHTLKGGARLAGAMRLGELAHRLETAIERLTASDAIATADVEQLLGRADALSTSFEALRAHDAQAYADAVDAALEEVVVQPVPFVPAALAPIDPFTEGSPEAATGLEAVPERISGQRDAASAEGSSAASIDWARFGAGPAVAATAQRAASVSSGAVRVRSQLLDRLVNQAGEVSITRARLESGLGQLKGSLGDLTDNLERMRQQLRDIELQAETQMASRLEAAKAAAQSFDPLEFDRFTRFQELTRMMAESVNDVATVQRNLQRALEVAEDELAAQARLTRELQDDLLRTRMIEFEGLSERLYRVVRQAAKETGKQVRLDIVGGSIEVDRGVLDRMTGSFEHLLRNCITHGIESVEQRAAAGKDAAGNIVVSLHQEGNEVSIEFRDDGAGLDLQRIRDKGLAMGLLEAEGSYSDAELANLIFTAGFSTADAVTELAGRGVGMDVVRSEVNALGGRIETASAVGEGTSFKLVLPLTTAVTQVVMLRCGLSTVAVPSTLVEIVRRAKVDEVEAAYASGSYRHGELSLPFFWLGALLQGSARGLETSTRTLPVVIVRSAQQRIALHVDEVLGNHEVVVKNLGPQLARLPGLAGMTLLASGTVALIYNPVALATVYADVARAATQASLDHAASSSGPVAPEPAAVPQAPLVLVVDDSLTVRRVTQRLLVREGYRVAVAKDGLDALEKLAQERPTLVLSDIEMPRMDGFDLVRNIRSDTSLASLPVIMITSRIAQKHRDYAAELGVSHYLGKPYNEEELLALIASYTASSIPDLML